MKWEYDGEVVENLPDGAIGFVYALYYSCGSIYIGKKLAKTVRRVKPTKAQLAIRKNFVSKKEIETKWRDYEGSSEQTKDLVLVRKEILEFCNDKINLTYCEMKHQVINNVLTSDVFVNSNILGKFYKGKIK